MSLPPFASSAMDGYAYRSEGVQDGDVLMLAGESLAGHPFQGTVGDGECIRITTGAAVPDSADTVVIQENCERTADGIRVMRATERGRNIRAVGHDVRAGETIGRGGRRLTPFDIGWLAACGITTVEVCARPRVAVFSTGDELVLPGGTLGEGQIFDSNRFALAALLKRMPVDIVDLGILIDDRAAIEAALRSAADQADLLLTSGGVSVGDADYVRDVVEALGSIDLWKLNLRPGKPLAFGHVGGTPFLGLPGNPVSTIVTFLLVAQPLLLKLCGATPELPEVRTARLRETVHHSPGREEYQRGILRTREGITEVGITGDQSSNRLATFSEADCLIRVPKDSGNLEAGESVEILPFFGLLG